MEDISKFSSTVTAAC